MRENRTYGSEGGESGSTGLPYPYRTSSFGTKPRWIGQIFQVIALHCSLNVATFASLGRHGDTFGAFDNAEYFSVSKLIF